MVRPEDTKRGKLAGGPWMILLAAVVVLVLGWLVLAGRTTTVAVEESPQPREERSGSRSRSGTAQGEDSFRSRTTPAELSPVRTGGEVTRPIKISGPNPQYTEVARQAKIDESVKGRRSR